MPAQTEKQSKPDAKRQTIPDIVKTDVNKMREYHANIEKLTRFVNKLGTNMAGYRTSDGTLVNKRLISALNTEFRAKLGGVPKTVKDAQIDEKKRKKLDGKKRKNPLYDPLDLSEELRNFFNDPSINFGYATPGDPKSGQLLDAMPHFIENGQTNRIQIAFLLQIHCLLEGSFLPGKGGLCKSTPAMNKYFGKIYQQIKNEQEEKNKINPKPNAKPFDENAISYINFQVLIAKLTKTDDSISKQEKETIRNDMKKENELVKADARIYKKQPELRIKAE